jgi:hypothetical protein
MEAPVAATLFVSARLDKSAPKFAAGGSPGAALGKPICGAS